jgi:hypothetical protein
MDVAAESYKSLTERYAEPLQRGYRCHVDGSSQCYAWSLKAKFPKDSEAN